MVVSTAKVTGMETFLVPEQRPRRLRRRVFEIGEDALADDDCIVHDNA